MADQNGVIEITGDGTFYTDDFSPEIDTVGRLKAFVEVETYASGSLNATAEISWDGGDSWRDYSTMETHTDLTSIASVSTQGMEMIVIYPQTRLRLDASGGASMTINYTMFAIAAS